MSEPSGWYGCRACGEMRRFPFEANAADSGCRCPTAAEVYAAELRAAEALEARESRERDRERELMPAR